jgi:exodeoxyribonuclease VII small subunit
MAKTRNADDIAALKYEAAAAELERLVQTMEQGQLPLEESLDAYRRGSELLRHCQKLLADAEERLRVLEGNELKPLALDPGARE